MVMMPDNFVNPMDSIGDAAGAAFEQALAGGADPAAAFEAAGAAAQGAAEGLGIPMEVFGPVMGAAADAFQGSIAGGADPAAAFEAAGNAAEGAVDHVAHIEAAGEQAFTEAIADGAAPMEAFEAAEAACGDMCADMGIPPDAFQAVAGPAHDAFQQAMDAGTPIDGCLDAAVQVCDGAIEGFADCCPNDMGPMCEGTPPPDGYGPEGFAPMFGPAMEGGPQDFAALDDALAPPPGPEGPADFGGDPVGGAMDANMAQGGAPEGPPAGDPAGNEFADPGIAGDGDPNDDQGGGDDFAA
ncbi:MAG: hypothetical protein CMM49_02205 [Rhodospirillaceae bacterium]|nr:hypothetical protein [Rhodospirillaceae bacterium]|tara:strand:- start:2254 stop:3147 length:894 start_codon:yes stop_codon:yes gene_type:complete